MHDVQNVLSYLVLMIWRESRNIKFLTKGRHFPDDIFNELISTKMSLNFAPYGPYNNIPAIIRILAWRRPGDKLLSEILMAYFTNACIRHSALISWKKLATMYAAM